MKKSFVITVVSVFMAFLTLACFGCGKKPANADPTAEPGDSEPAVEKITAEQLYNDVLAVSGFGNMTAVSKRDYAEIYGIDANNFLDHIWYQSENPSLNADEIAIFLVKNEKEHYVSVLKSLLEKHIETRLNVAESYSPEEAGKLREAEVTTVQGKTGTWVFFCVGSEYDDMMRAFKADLF